MTLPASSSCAESAPRPSPLDASIAERAEPLLREFAASAAARDAAGGCPRAERARLRESGLLAMSIPTELGGLGADWVQTLDVVRRLARVDSSLAHVFGFHHLLLATLQLFGQPRQWRPWLEQSAQQRWFWGNALNPLDRRSTARRDAAGQGYVVSGHKRFCTGSVDAERLIVSALDEASGRLLVAALPADRAGITVHEDWDGMGQRQTDSGSVRFEAVRVADEELLLDPGPLSTPRACLRPLLAQLVFCQLFLGLAEGAFEAARQHTREQARPWIKSSAPEAAQDLFVLRHFGEFWVGLEASRALVGRATALFEAAWRQGEALTPAGRAEVALAVASAKVASSRHGLDLCSRLFEVSGASASQGALRLDRFWRNLRTQSLHDPLDYKLLELGQWALNQQAPAPSFYS